MGDVHMHEAGTPNHSHGEMMMVDAASAPSLEIEVTEDPKSGFNVELKTVNFTFSPENASKEHVEGEGHAHIYVDGEKIGRLYGNWAHVDELASGEHEIRVTLNTNDHMDYAVDGQVVQDTETVTVK